MSEALNSLLGKVVTNIVNPTIALLFAVALLVFLWGLFEFISHTDDEGGREKGKQNIMWGLVGMAIMVSAFGIIGIILNTFGISGHGIPTYLK